MWIEASGRGLPKDRVQRGTQQQRAQDGFLAPGTSLHKNKIKKYTSQLCQYKDKDIHIMYSTFYLIEELFFLNLREMNTLFESLKALGRGPVAFWPPAPWPRSCRPPRHTPPHSLLLLAPGFQFSKLTTDHTPVTYTIREEKLLFLLCNVREFSNLWLWVNLLVLVKLPRVELSPNMLVLQNTCESLRSPSSCYNNGQTQGKPKPGATMMNDWFLFLFPSPVCIWL